MPWTMSTNLFYKVVARAVKYGVGLSVVRMGDGERRLMLLSNSKLDLDSSFTKEWTDKLGITGLKRTAIKELLWKAAKNCSFFAPSITGKDRISFSVYEFFPKRRTYVNNFFVNEWTEEMILALYKEAGHVLMIHGNAHTADSLQLRLQGNDIAKVDYIKLTKWQEAQDVLTKARESKAPLVLVSAGPGSKWIIPEIELGTKKVVLDIGNAMDHWVPQSLPIDRPKAEAFYKIWQETQV
jgi:hypothetical protein